MEFDRIQRDPSADNREKDLLVFAMYFDFMSYVAQRLGCYQERGTSLEEGRTLITVVITACTQRFQLANDKMSNGMYVIVNESYPEPRYIEDGNSDYQAQKTAMRTAYTARMLLMQSR